MPKLLCLLLALPACLPPPGSATAPGAGGGASTGPGGATAAGAAGPVVAVTAAGLAIAPVVITAPPTPISTKRSALGFEAGGSMAECSNRTTARPIASFELRETIPGLVIQLEGGSWVNSGDGFFLHSGGQLFGACDKSHSLDGRALPPGRYDVYPAFTCRSTATVPMPGRPGYYDEVCNDMIEPTLWLYAKGEGMPTQPRQVVTLDNLEQPRFVEVTLAPGRQVVPQALAGTGCERDAYTLQPDVMLELPEPRADVTVTILPTVRPVRVASQGNKYGRVCRDDGRGKRHLPSPNRESRPTFVEGNSLGLGAEFEGRFALWLGSEDPADTTTKVTLMISDKTTRFAPLARFEPGFPLDTVERRWLGALFPQLSLYTVTQDDRHARFVAAAALFAATPDAALVYAKRDLPAADAGVAVAKGEPLAVVGVYDGDKQILGLTADGLIVRVKGNAYVLAPPGPRAYPATPRPTAAEALWAMVPPEHAKKAEAYHAKFTALDACRERAFAPYAARLPQVMPGYEIAMKSPEYVRIENAGRAAQDQKCGTRAKLEAKLAPERAKLEVLVQAERARLLEVALASHAR